MSRYREDRLRENRQDYQKKLLLGFGRGKGLLSVVIFAVYDFFTRKKDGKKSEHSPDEFETIHKDE